MNVQGAVHLNLLSNDNTGNTGDGASTAYRKVMGLASKVSDLSSCYLFICLEYLIVFLSLKVVVKTLTGKSLTLNVKSSDTIQLLKDEIHSAEGIPPDQQRLRFGETQLEEDRTIGDYNIHKASTPRRVLMLELKRMWGLMQIFVRFNGKSMILKVDSSHLIFELKEQIESKCKLPRDKQLLIYEGKWLNDWRTVAYYNIQKDSTIELRVLFATSYSPASEITCTKKTTPKKLSTKKDQVRTTCNQEEGAPKKLTTKKDHVITTCNREEGAPKKLTPMEGGVNNSNQEEGTPNNSTAKKETARRATEMRSENMKITTTTTQPEGASKLTAKEEVARLAAQMRLENRKRKWPEDSATAVTPTGDKWQESASKQTTPSIQQRKKIANVNISDSPEEVQAESTYGIGKYQLDVLASDNLIADAPTFSMKLGQTLSHAFLLPADRMRLESQDLVGFSSQMLGHITQAMAWAAAVDEKAKAHQELVRKAEREAEDTQKALSAADTIVKDLRRQLKEAENSNHLMQVEADKCFSEQLEELNSVRAKLAEVQEAEKKVQAQWFIAGQDDIIVKAKEVGLDHKPLLVDPEDDPTE